MGLFGKSFGEKVADAVAAVNGRNLGIRNFRAVVDGKAVTLEGEVPSLDIKGRVVQAFNALVNTENTINKIQVAAAVPPGAAPVVETDETHVVVVGDTLSALAKKYYGKASLYMKIFEANRNILSNPDLIKIGQKIRIPK